MDDEDLLTFERIAVTPELIDQLKLPSRPNKITDTRHETFIREFPGYEATELDAIRPGTLREMVQNCILSLVDPDAVDRIKHEEQQARELASQIQRSVRGRA